MCNRLQKRNCVVNVSRGMWKSLEALGYCIQKGYARVGPLRLCGDSPRFRCGSAEHQVSVLADKFIWLCDSAVERKWRRSRGFESNRAKWVFDRMFAKF